MLDKFCKFMDELDKASGKHSLCEAIVKGYKALTESESNVQGYSDVLSAPANIDNCEIFDRDIDVNGWEHTHKGHGYFYCDLPEELIKRYSTIHEEGILPNIQSKDPVYASEICIKFYDEIEITAMSYEEETDVPYGSTMVTAYGGGGYIDDYDLKPVKVVGIMVYVGGQEDDHVFSTEEFMNMFGIDQSYFDDMIEKMKQLVEEDAEKRFNDAW